MRLVIGLAVIICAFGFIQAQNDFKDEWESEPVLREWSDESDDAQYFNENEEDEADQDFDDANVLKEIEEFGKILNNEEESDSANFEDYQIEDNRSSDKELVDIPVALPNQVADINDVDSAEEDINIQEPEPVPIENEQTKKIFEETNDILSEDADNDFSSDEKDPIDNFANDKPNFNDDVDDDKQIENNEDQFEEAIPENPELMDSDTVDINDNIPNEDDLDKLLEINQEEIRNVYYEEEIDDELNQLFDQLDAIKGNGNSAQEDEISKEIEQLFEKLSHSQDDTNAENKFSISEESNSNDDDEVDNIDTKINDEQMLSKTDEQLDDDTVSNVLDDLDDDLKQLFDTWDKLTNDDEAEAADDNKSDDSDEVLNSNLGDIFNEIETNNNENLEDSSDDEDKLSKIFYLNDGLVNDIIKDVDVEESEDAKEDTNNAEVKSEDSSVQSEVEQTKILNVSEITTEQYAQLMKQFAEANKDEIDIKSDDFAKDVAAIHIKLNTDEPTIITSPNYPNAYPTNNIVDWIFDGEGTGIELNITDFAVNGVLGDYLMIKPGGLDDSGSEGLLFSYTLTAPRRYRFLDVDRMFVRFQSNLGLPWMRGFEISAKLIAPLPEDPEPEPTPAPLLPNPAGLLTVVLGGVTAAQFVDIKEQFTQLIADMATTYINANGIEMGVHNTSETTQIVHAGACNVNWPNFERCVEVRFGVPLVYADEDITRLTEDELSEMWNMFIEQDPFATRLWRMGITDFAIPNDNRMMLIWLVIAGGVLISAAMLAIALWRFSCFEDYTRMAAFSDTDSLYNEKKQLDLYPTPHQPLPPLYSDPDFKWDDGKFDDSIRVDIGGFSNKSFAADELFDIDSDEDGIGNGNSNRNIRPSDIYQA